MLNLVLFSLKFVFLFFLYLFIFYLARSIFRDSRVAHEVAQISEAPQTAQAKLLSLSKQNEEHLLPDLIVIGRSEKSDVQLDDNYVSYKHARVVLKGSDYFLEDLGSTNGTFLNNKKIKKAKLADGDIITIGKNSYKFVTK